MGNFNKAFQATMGHEGGYSNNPHDTGGETYAGITRKFHPDWEGWEIIDSVKQVRKIKRGEIIPEPYLSELVKRFYREKYWDVSYLDYVEDQSIAEELFDSSVNMGIRTATKMIQESLNLLGVKELRVDGILGRNTLTRINEYEYPAALLKALNGFQFMRYVEIVKSNPSQKVFFRGWLKRVHL